MDLLSVIASFVTMLTAINPMASVFGFVAHNPVSPSTITSEAHNYTNQTIPNSNFTVTGNPQQVGNSTEVDLTNNATGQAVKNYVANSTEELPSNQKTVLECTEYALPNGLNDTSPRKCISWKNVTVNTTWLPPCAGTAWNENCSKIAQKENDTGVKVYVPCTPPLLCTDMTHVIIGNPDSKTTTIAPSK